MNIEKFVVEQEGKEVDGVRVSFTFSTNNNKNGVYFNPLDIYSADPCKKFDKNHSEKFAVFDDSSMTLSAPRINGKRVEYDAVFESTNETHVELVTSESFSGFSPDIASKMAPVPSRKASPRFYPDGAMELTSWSILTNMEPAFNGAGEFQVEKFSVNSQPNIVEKFGEENQPSDTQDPKPEEKPKQENQPEKFYFYGNVGEWCKVISTGQIGKVNKIEQLEGGTQNITLTLVDGKEMIIADNQNNETRVLGYLSVSDIFDYLLNNKESFSTKDDNENKGKEIQKNLEKFSKNQEGMDKHKQVKQFSKGETPVKKHDEAKTIESIKQKFNLK